MSNKTKKTYSFSYVMDILAYVAVCFFGVAMFLSMILGRLGVSASILGLMTQIADIIGWIVLSLLSFYFIKNRRKIWMWVVWVIAIVMIIIGVIL